MKLLSEQDGSLLVHLARKAIKTYLTESKLIQPPELDEALKEKRGVFCTLKNHVNGNLRGCIGLPYPTMPLGKAVIEAAVSSATNDPRFPKMTLDEFDEVVLEITVLTPPEKLECPPEQIPEKVQTGKHGIIIKQESASGLLLPQVATENNWNSEKFLEMTCWKAGLEKNCWKESDVFLFEGQVFKETMPNGKIILE